MSTKMRDEIAFFAYRLNATFYLAVIDASQTAVMAVERSQALFLGVSFTITSFRKQRNTFLLKKAGAHLSLMARFFASNLLFSYLLLVSWIHYAIAW